MKENEVKSILAELVSIMEPLSETDKRQALSRKPHKEDNHHEQKIHSHREIRRSRG